MIEVKEEGNGGVTKQATEVSKKSAPIFEKTYIPLIASVSEP